MSHTYTCMSHTYTHARTHTHTHNHTRTHRHTPTHPHRHTHTHNVEAPSSCQRQAKVRADGQQTEAKGWERAGAAGGYRGRGRQSPRPQSELSRWWQAPCTSGMPPLLLRPGLPQPPPPREGGARCLATSCGFSSWCEIGSSSEVSLPAALTSERGGTSNLFAGRGCKETKTKRGDDRSVPGKKRGVEGGGSSGFGGVARVRCSRAVAPGFAIYQKGGQRRGCAASDKIACLLRRPCSP